MGNACMLLICTLLLQPICVINYVNVFLSLVKQCGSKKKSDIWWIWIKIGHLVNLENLCRQHKTIQDANLLSSSGSRVWVEVRVRARLVCFRAPPGQGLGLDNGQCRDNMNRDEHDHRHPHRASILPPHTCRSPQSRTRSHQIIWTIIQQ